MIPCTKFFTGPKIGRRYYYHIHICMFKGKKLEKWAEKKRTEIIINRKAKLSKNIYKDSQTFLQSIKCKLKQE